MFFYQHNYDEYFSYKMDSRFGPKAWNPRGTRCKGPMNAPVRNPKATVRLAVPVEAAMTAKKEKT